MANDKKPTTSKFSPWIIYGIVFSIFIGLTYFKGSNFSDPTKISASKFDELLNGGKIEKVNVFDKTEGEAYLTQGALKEKQFEKNSKDVSGKLNKGPHFTFDIGNDEIFQNKLAKASADGKLKEYNFDKKIDWVEQLIGFIPIY